jgi:hypothetical protein
MLTEDYPSGGPDIQQIGGELPVAAPGWAGGETPVTVAPKAGRCAAPVTLR